MRTTHDLAIQAVVQYFDGERREMLMILGGSLGVVLASTVFFLAVRDGFAKGWLITVVACALVLSLMAGSLLMRDAKLRTALTSPANPTATAPAGPAEQPFASERARIGGVISKYRLYRTAAVVLGVLALAVLSLTRQSWLHGVGAGLLLLVIAQSGIDHYSERRARAYSDALATPEPDAQPHQRTTRAGSRTGQNATS